MSPPPPAGEVTLVGYVRRNEQGDEKATTPQQGSIRLINSDALATWVGTPLVNGYIGLLEVTPPRNGEIEFESLRPKESWDHKLRRLMAYFEEDTQLRDILITGGDALMSQNKTLRNILEAVYRMACRKRKANQARPDGEKYAELQRVRLGSRLPAYLPVRIDDQLVEVLKEFREKASAVRSSGSRRLVVPRATRTAPA